MHVNVIQNADYPLGDLLNYELSDVGQFRVASAFLNSRGLGYVLPNIQRILFTQEDDLSGVSTTLRLPPALTRLRLPSPLPPSS